MNNVRFDQLITASTNVLVILVILSKSERAVGTNVTCYVCHTEDPESSCYTNVTSDDTIEITRCEGENVQCGMVLKRYLNPSRDFHTTLRRGCMADTECGPNGCGVWDDKLNEHEKCRYCCNDTDLCNDNNHAVARLRYTHTWIIDLGFVVMGLHVVMATLV